MWALIYVAAFIAAFLIGAASKAAKPSWTKDYTADWNDSVGTVHKDISYGEAESNTFDLYVAAGINYTLRNEAHPEASVYSQSMEIKESVPVVIAEAKRLGYPINEMAISGGSAGHCLAMLYAYRDAADSPVPVRMVFGAVGPSSFYPQDWGCYGLDKNTSESREAAAGLFGIMAGKVITADMFGTPAYDEAMKDISALLWVDDDTVPSLMAYGKHDKVQAFEASIRLDEALTAHNIPHDYIVLEHSGHGLQNDNREFHKYYQKIEEYLDKYMPVN